MPCSLASKVRQLVRARLQEVLELGVVAHLLFHDELLLPEVHLVRHVHLTEEGLQLVKHRSLEEVGDRLRSVRDVLACEEVVVHDDLVVELDQLLDAVWRLLGDWRFDGEGCLDLGLVAKVDLLKEVVAVLAGLGGVLLSYILVEVVGDPLFEVVADLD